MGDQKKVLPNVGEKSTPERPNSLSHKRDKKGSHSAYEGQHSQQDARAVLDSTQPASHSSYILRGGANYNHQTQGSQGSSSQSSRPMSTQLRDKSVSFNLGQNQQSPICRPPSSNPQHRHTPTHPKTTQRNRARGQQLPNQHYIPMETNQHLQMGYRQYSHANTHYPNVAPTTTYLLHVPQTHSYMQWPWSGNCYYHTGGQFNGYMLSHGTYLLPSGININFTQYSYPPLHNVSNGYLTFPVYLGPNSSALLPTNARECRAVADPYLDQNYGNPLYIQQYEGNTSNHMNHDNLWMVNSDHPSQRTVFPEENPYQHFTPAESYRAYPENSVHSFHAPQQATNHDDNTWPYQPLYHSSVWGPPPHSTNTWGIGNPSSQFSGTNGVALDDSSCSVNNYRDSNLSYFTNDVPYQPGISEAADTAATSMEGRGVVGAQSK